jgi:hypothetical protein
VIGRVPVPAEKHGQIVFSEYLDDSIQRGYDLIPAGNTESSSRQKIILDIRH